MSDIFFKFLPTSQIYQPAGCQNWPHALIVLRYRCTAQCPQVVEPGSCSFVYFLAARMLPVEAQHWVAQPHNETDLYGFTGTASAGSRGGLLMF